MDSIEKLEQVIGNEYFMDNAQRQALLSELKFYADLSSTATIIGENKPQPHTNKIISMN